MTGNPHYKKAQARLVLTPAEAAVLADVLGFVPDSDMAAMFPALELQTIQRIKTKLGVEIARVGFGKLKGSGR